MSDKGAFREWVSIIRFGIVQASIVSITVLPISTIPRLMIKELSLLAIAPGILIGAYYVAQGSRLPFGYRADVLGRRTPWIIGGHIVLAIAGVLTCLSVWLMSLDVVLGYVAAMLSFALVGIGVGAAGTTLFALIATTVHPVRRAPAATVVWLLMIAGLAFTAGMAGAALEPFSYARLVEVAITVSLIAVVVSTVGLWGIEARLSDPHPPEAKADRSWAAMRRAIDEIWHEPAARTLTIFIFASMFAFNMQELVLEPFSAAVYGYSVAESTTLGSFHRSGILIGLIIAAVSGSLLKSRPQTVVALAIGGCASSAALLIAIALSGFVAPAWPLQPTIAVYGISNGVFAGAAVASIFSLASVGRERREGTRMGLFGLAQAAGFGLGMLSGAIGLDLARASLGEVSAYATVFFVEAAVFLLAATLALKLSRAPALNAPAPMTA